MNTDLPIRFTHHALDRLKEWNLSRNKAVWMLQTGIKIKPSGMSKYKREKYGDNSENIQYWQNDTIVFTVRVQNDKYTGEEMVLVITVTDQRVNLREINVFGEL